MKVEAPAPTANVPDISNCRTGTSNVEFAIVTVMPAGIKTEALPYGIILPCHVVGLLNTPLCAAVKLNVDEPLLPKPGGAIY
jgi:hypothetical protein